MEDNFLMQLVREPMGKKTGAAKKGTSAEILGEKESLSPEEEGTDKSGRVQGSC